MDIGRVTAQEGVRVAAARQIEQPQRRTDGIVEDDAGLHQVCREVERICAHVKIRLSVRQCRLVEQCGGRHWIVSLNSIARRSPCVARPTGLRGCTKLEPAYTDVRRFGELVSSYHAPCNGLIASKLDLNVCRFGRNCDDVLTKRGDQIRQTAAWRPDYRRRLGRSV